MLTEILSSVLLTDSYVSCVVLTVVRLSSVLLTDSNVSYVVLTVRFIELWCVNCNLSSIVLTVRLSSVVLTET